MSSDFKECVEPSKLLKDSAIREVKNSIDTGTPFRYIISFDTRKQADESLDFIRSWKCCGVELYYRPICLTRDNRWRLYISNHKLQTYSVLK